NGRIRVVASDRGGGTGPAKRDRARGDRREARGRETQRVAPRRTTERERAEGGRAGWARSGRGIARGGASRRDGRRHGHAALANRVAVRVLELDHRLLGERYAALRAARGLGRERELCRRAR